jgi:hypothetical protein
VSYSIFSASPTSSLSYGKENKKQKRNDKPHILKKQENVGFGLLCDTLYEYNYSRIYNKMQ